ncbi:MAG TPA: tRNA guanosine(34) transglycosylase Tgt [Planctomycetota bacterium]|nr:tRNA guanosine(34) transglycosylase Tgt [Planctomycetota bacterium]
MSGPVTHQLLATPPVASARRGILRTAHGDVQTPHFMPVATLGAIKGESWGDLAATAHTLRAAGLPGSPGLPVGDLMVLMNAFHLTFRPGHEEVRARGGLHKFTGYSGPILTDSGGFQVYSLEGLRKVTDDGAQFRSPYDESPRLFTPEHVMDIEAALGPDIAMQFDHCPPALDDPALVAAAMRRSAAWGDRCLARWADVRQPHQALFGICQGGVSMELRKESAQRVAEQAFDGCAIGGLSVGESQAQMFEMLDVVLPILPSGKARYLMGVGTPQDILGGVERGVDLFDCVMPTRSARHGLLFTWQGKLRIRNSRHKDSDEPIDPACGCATCRRHSRAYLRHLHMTKEINSVTLLTIHNLHFYQELMARIRAALSDGTFAQKKAGWLESLKPEEGE